ncbi:MAG: hypothetical protein DMG34_22550 [Acidobacteria bacterium]|nr:MAG: hypothetical protein DMG34_22550 [Acidobacteriota bacterium]
MLRPTVTGHPSRRADSLTRQDLPASVSYQATSRNRICVMLLPTLDLTAARAAKPMPVTAATGPHKEAPQIAAVHLRVSARTLRAVHRRTIRIDPRGPLAQVAIIAPATP